ncbi:MAG: LysR family transcriptional regulator [Rhizobiales bacterium]|nr:LysR family transcriptional regulator [Hyphomicrobiales bacterium]
MARRTHSNESNSAPPEKNSLGNRRRIPPLPALRAFEAAARRLSFREAALDIAVTPSAISHQVKSLETCLGVALFVREPHGLQLTRTGRDYLKDLIPLLDALDASTRRIAESDRSGTLRVLATPGFAARWLVPRLDRFSGNDSISISVSQGAPCSDFAKNNADVVIHWGAEPVAGAVVQPMMKSGRYPVASPQLIEREGIREPADLLNLTLLHDEVDDGWAAWFAAAGLAAPDLVRGPRLAHCELTMTAAEKNQGVALAYDAMARATVASGRLTRLFDVETPPKVIYSFAYPTGRRRCPNICALRDWMFGEIEADGLLDQNAHPVVAA